MSWDQTISLFAISDNLLTVRRSLGFWITLEAALKFKETSCMHAEAFRGAELMHGPLAMAKGGMPVLMFIQNDRAAPG